MARLFSYVVEHDEGLSPHPSGRYCTLVHCKWNTSGKRRNVVELAQEGDWIVGTGGANMKKSAGHGKIVYAMKVTRKLTLRQYLASREFNGRLDRHSGPRAAKRFALVSDDFFYFGTAAIRIPPRFAKHSIEKKGRAFRNSFDQAFIAEFEQWIRGEHSPGIHGQPCRPRQMPKKACSCG